jgi:lupus La protein
MSEVEKKEEQVQKVEEETSSDAGEILKQVEFYFSDQNLPKDKFLFKVTQQNDGWVPISTIASFSRMKKFRPVSAVVDALRQSKELLEVSEDGESVRRKLPLVEPKKEEIEAARARSIYAKGFPDEHKGLQIELEKYFEGYAPVKEVRMRRTEDKKFKNSVFVEFASVEDAKKFLEADPKPTYNDNELLTMSKNAYIEMKAAEHGFANNANGKRPKKFNAFREQKKRNFDDRRGGRGGDHKRRKFDRPNDRNKEKEEQAKAEADESKQEKPAEESKPADESKQEPKETAKEDAPTADEKKSE